MSISRRKLLTLAAVAAAPVGGYFLETRTHAAARLTAAIAERRSMREFPFRVSPIARPAERIVISSKTDIPLEPGLTVPRLADVLQRYVSDYLAPVWGVSADVTAASRPDPTAWNIVLMDSFDDNTAVAFHAIDGPAPSTHLPYAPVSVSAAMQYPGSVCWAASHEIGEMLVNPGINLWADSEVWTGQAVAKAPLMAQEIADPVQESTFLIDGFQCSNFVFPAYFETWREPTQLDFLDTLQYRTIAPGGYQILRDGKHSWSVTGERAPALQCWRARRILAPHVGAKPNP